MSLKPAFPAPPGVTQVVTADPRDNPDSIASEVIRISLPMCIAATVVVLLRLYARLSIVRSFGKDDCQYITIRGNQMLIVRWNQFTLSSAWYSNVILTWNLMLCLHGPGILLVLCRTGNLQ